MTDLGTHVLLDLDGCPRELLQDGAALRAGLREAALLGGATIVAEAFHTFDPPAVSGVLLIAESHLSVHTWPDLGKATLDIYTCGSAFDARAAADRLALSLRATRQRRVEVKRGFGAGVVDAQAP